MSTDLTRPFRGSAAVAAGSLTPGVLRGPRYRRLFPDVYAPACLDVDLALRARAAGVLLAGRGAVAGYTDLGAVKVLRNRHLGVHRGGPVRARRPVNAVRACLRSWRRHWTRANGDRPQQTRAAGDHPSRGMTSAPYASMVASRASCIA
jgi:hypothetical protein